MRIRLNSSGRAILGRQRKWTPPLYSPFTDQRQDRHLLTVGEALTPASVARALRSADTGETQHLYTICDDMPARDPHLASEIEKARAAITGGKLYVLPWPPADKPDKIAQQVKEFVFTLLTAPWARLDRMLTALWNGDLYGAGAFRYGTDIGRGNVLRVSEVSTVPPFRLRFERDTNIPLYWQSAETDDVVPLDTRKDIVAYFGFDGIMSPARRGILRSLLAHWLIRTQGLTWWSEAVHDWAVPYRIGRVPPNNPKAESDLRAAFEAAGRKPWLITTTEATVQLMSEGAALLRSQPPHLSLLQHCGEEMSKRLVGANLLSQIHGKGSFAAADVQLTGFERLTLGRAAGIIANLREQFIYQAVMEQFGPDVADENTPALALIPAGIMDPELILKIIGSLVAAGDKSVPIRWAHEAFFIPDLRGNEPTFSLPQPQPQQPGEPAGTGAPRQQ